VNGGFEKMKTCSGMSTLKGAENTKTAKWKGKHLFDPEQAMNFRCQNLAESE